MFLYTKNKMTKKINIEKEMENAKGDIKNIADHGYQVKETLVDNIELNKENVNGMISVFSIFFNSYATINREINYMQMVSQSYNVLGNQTENNEKRQMKVIFEMSIETICNELEKMKEILSREINYFNQFNKNINIDNTVFIAINKLYTYFKLDFPNKVMAYINQI